MKSSLTASLSRIYQKNADEILAFGLGRMPSFVTGGASLGGRPAVFCYHDIGPARFEEQLRRLTTEGYNALDCDGLDARAEASTNGRDVALTFDDGTWTFYTYVYPLLQRYQVRAILFVIAGLVPEDETGYPNLEAVWEGRATEAELEARGRQQPLCSWRELREMHESGLVDIQSHSMTHSRVPTSSRVIDFFFPGFPVETYGNVNIPLPAGDDPRAPRRALPMGAPIFESASRMAAIPRFVENSDSVSALARHVEASGGDRFFERDGWRSELSRLWRGAADGQHPERFESDSEMEATVFWELSESKRRLEERLPGKTVTHFCYPWFQGSATTDRLAGRAGYRAVHYGIALPRDPDAHPLPRRIQRISEEYLCRLPGPGRISLLGVAKQRFGGSLRRLRGAR